MTSRNEPFVPVARYNRDLGVYVAAEPVRYRKWGEQSRPHEVTFDYRQPVLDESTLKPTGETILMSMDEFHGSALIYSHLCEGGMIKTPHAHEYCIWVQEGKPEGGPRRSERLPSPRRAFLIPENMVLENPGHLDAILNDRDVHGFILDSITLEDGYFRVVLSLPRVSYVTRVFTSMEEMEDADLGKEENVVNQVTTEDGSILVIYAF